MCFLDSLQQAATKFDRKHLVEDAKVHASVYISQPADSDLEGHTLQVRLGIDGLEDDEIIGIAQDVCSIPFLTWTTSYVDR